MGEGSNRKIFVIFNELEVGKLCRQHLSSDYMEIRFQGSQQHGLGPFQNNFANFTFSGGEGVKNLKNFRHVLANPSLGSRVNHIFFPIFLKLGFRVANSMG